MTILICRHAEVIGHWKQTLTALRKILPENGHHYTLSNEEGYEVELTVGNAAREVTLRYDGRHIPVVPFLDVPSGRTSTYWLAWHEGWRQPQTGTGRDRRQYRSSSIAVYVGEPGSNKDQVLRAEWAGAEYETVGKSRQIVFQGRGAAHPHWHLAGLENNGNIATRGLSQFEPAEPAAIGLAAFADEAGDAGAVRDGTAFLEAGRNSRLDMIEPAWASIHLATSARWAQMEWTGPSGPHDTHSANPVNCGEIRSWVVSCVRYLQSELQGQVRRGRW